MTDPQAPPITEAMAAPAAARAAEEALRQAVHASWDGIGTAADVYTVFGVVGYSLELMPQLLDQLTTWLEKHAGSLDVTDAGGGTAADRIAEIRAAVTAASETIDVGRTRVAAAQATLAPVFGPVAS
jgi:hypothetical protein